MNPPPESTRLGLLARPWLRLGLYGVAAYGGFVVMLLMVENRLVFHPTSAAQSWIAPPSHDIQDVALTCADGTRIHAWWCPCPDSDLAVLYCHGNAGNLSHRGASIVKLCEILRASVLIIDYPGYGKSEGRPTEAGCYQAADTAYAWLTDEKKFAPKKIILYGASLGGGVSVDLASRKDHRALVLVKTFTSVPDVACDIYWWMPVPIRTLMATRFDSIGKIRSCHRPVFIGHGTADGLIHYSHGEKLYQAANTPKHFFSMPGSGHNDGLPEEFFQSLQAFLKENPVE